MFDTPILLITFNRPDFTRRVLESVMEQQPRELYVFQDGPRPSHPDDAARVAEVRQVVEELTDSAPTRLHTRYAPVNWGCGPGPADALTWFFGQVEQGIVLEDDAVPHPDFFLYAQELLERYAADPSVMAIGSMNVDRTRPNQESYYFSMMNRNLCAWATWRRAWQHFDLRLMDVSRGRLRRALRRYGCGLLEREYWCDRLDEVHRDGVGNSSWDMQFFMSIWLNHGKGVIPNVNLSSNIGTVVDATHPSAAGNLIDSVPTHPILPLTHPVDCRVQHEADRAFHFSYFEPSRANWSAARKVYFIINKRAKRLLGHKGSWRKRN